MQQKGIITDEMKIVAKKESIQINQLIDLMAIGQVVIPANKNHKSLDPHGIGKNLRTKVNVNLGISRDCMNIEKEIEKVKIALDMNIESIMDLSSYGKTKEFRDKINRVIYCYGRYSAYV